MTGVQTCARPIRYGSDRYGSDRYGSEPATQPVFINNPDYVQYRLRKAFEDNWAAAEPKRP